MPLQIITLVWLAIMNVWGYRHWNTANTIADIQKAAIKALKQGVTVFKPYKCTTAIDFRLVSVFFIILEHFSPPTLMFPFKFWEGKC